MFENLSVINSRFNDLRRQKGLKEGRDISLRTVAKETGLAFTTLARVSNNDEAVQSVRLSTVNVLCDYFEVSDVNELIQYKRS